MADALPPATDDVVTLDAVDVAPLLDGTDPAAVAAAIDRACRAHGFFTIRGHGVDDELLAAALASADRLFALAPDAKDALRVDTPPGVQRGYTGLGAEAQALAVGAATAPDLSETFAIGDPPSPAHGPFAAPNVWPDIAGFESVWTRYRAAMAALAGDLLGACALAVTGDRAAWSHLVLAPIGSTRANHYPALDTAPGSEQWRGGAHTDYGTLTILLTDGVPGLEIRGADGRWRPVRVADGELVVNVGDLLSMLVDGRWPSTWHRVTTPPGPPPYPARTSIAHFQFPDHDAVVAGLAPVDREPSATAGAYLRHKLAQLVGVGEGTPS